MKVPARALRYAVRRVNRSVEPGAGIVTAFHDGVVTLRTNRRTEGYQESLNNEGYVGVRRGDLVIHGLDLVHGAAGVSDSEGQMSPVCWVLTPVDDMDGHFLSYSLRAIARAGYVRANAKGVRSAGADYRRWETLAEIPVPAPPLSHQRAAVRFLDRETELANEVIALRRSQLALMEEERASAVAATLATAEDPWVPLKAMIGFREGPGIMASDFRDAGVPLLRVRNLVGDSIDLEGCGYLEPDMVRQRWARFRVQPGEILISGSATSGLPVLVPEYAAGAVPYTGLIRMWIADERLDRDYLRCFLASSLFADQIDLLKTGVAIQHWGPNHLRQIKVPLPPLALQRERARRVLHRAELQRRLAAEADAQIASLNDYRDAVIAEVVTGRRPIAASSGGCVEVEPETDGVLA